MGTTPTEVLAFPNIRAIVRDNGTAEVVVAGNSRVVPDGASLQELRNNALALVVGEAKTLQRPVRVQIEDPEGHGELIVHTDNKIESVCYEPRQTRRRAQAPETTPEAVAPAIIDTIPVPTSEPVHAPAQPTAVETAAAVVNRQPWPPAPAEPDTATSVVAESPSSKEQLASSPERVLTVL